MTVAEQLFGIVGMALDNETPPGPKCRWVFYPRHGRNGSYCVAQNAVSLVEFADLGGLHRFINLGPNTYILTLNKGIVTPYECIPRPYPEEDILVPLKLTPAVTRHIRGAIRLRLSV